MRVLRLLFMASIREFTRPSMAAIDRQRAKPTPRIETMMAIVSVFMDLSYHVTALGRGFPGCYRSPDAEKVQHRANTSLFVVRKGLKFAHEANLGCHGTLEARKMQPDRQSSRILG